MYKLITYTSNIRGAGTDANVYVDIRGVRASSGTVFLKNANPNCFERAQKDEFEVGWGCSSESAWALSLSCCGVMAWCCACWPCCCYVHT